VAIDIMPQNFWPIAFFNLDASQYIAAPKKL